MPAPAGKLCDGQAFKPESQNPVATPASSRRLSELCGVSPAKVAVD